MAQGVDEAAELIRLANAPSVRRVRDFEATARLVSEGDVLRMYEILRDGAPRRSSAGKKYFVGHDGIPSTTGVSNRTEEHLAIALANDGRPLEIPGLGSCTILDYQVPLKARRSDLGIGKIDLLGVSGSGTFLVVELKAPSHGARGDSPLRATLEALAYAALLEADIGAIAAEAQSAFHIAIATDRPEIAVAAPTGYWEYWRAIGIHDTKAFARRAGRALNTQIAFVDLGSVDVNMGADGMPPSLRGALRLVAV